jgi:DNA-binding LytR/AlgR family response regulator
MAELTALIAEDEILMRDRLRKALADAWPELHIVAEAANGVEALAKFEAHRPGIVFLDIRMPGKSGLEVAAEIGDAAHVVFVTAFDEYAVQAFENGAADYLLKPVEAARLETTVERLKKRLAAPPSDLSSLLENLLNRAGSGANGGSNGGAQRLKWIRASLGNQTRLINVADVMFFQSDTKYTRIVTRDAEALVRTPLKEIMEGLDPDEFWQVHRSTVVSARAIDRAVREGPEKLVLHLKEHREKLPVSRQFFHLFKQN